MQTSSRRVTARIVQTEAGETFTEYVVGGVGYSSLSELKAAMGGV